MAISNQEADARWIEAVIRFTDGLKLRDPGLARLLRAEDPDPELVYRRLEKIAVQDEILQKLAFVGYRPPPKLVRPKAAIQAEMLVKMRAEIRLNALSSLALDRAG